MKKTKLGEFEEFVLLAVGVLQEDAYGVRIRKELEDRMNQTLSVGSVQSALKRLEDKGFLTSHFGAPTPVRGGKRKRIYLLTPYAQKVLHELRDLRNQLWDSLPDFAI